MGSRPHFPIQPSSFALLPRAATDWRLRPVLTGPFCDRWEARRSPGSVSGGHRDHPLSARIVSARDVSSRTAPVAWSSPMLAPQAQHRQFMQIPNASSVAACLARPPKS